MLIIREAEARELNEILDLWDEFTRYLNRMEPQFFQLKPDAREIYHKILQNYINCSDHLVLIVEDEEKLVGYHIASIRYPNEVFIQEPYGHISDIYLKEKYRKQNVGVKLIDHSIKWLKMQGVSNLNVKTFLFNHKGMSFWRRNGFEAYETVFKISLNNSF